MKAKLVKESLNESTGYNVMMSTMQKVFSPGLFDAVQEELADNPGSFEGLFADDDPKIVEQLEQQIPGIANYGLMDKWFLLDGVMYDDEDEEDSIEELWWEVQEILMNSLNFKRIPINSEYYDEIFFDYQNKIGYVEAEKNNPYQSGYNIWFYQN
jgi:hypothetical protein